MTLNNTEFIRRFLMHSLPNGFVRIRYYGFLANRYRRERLEQCRSLLGIASVSVSDPAGEPEPPTEEMEQLLSPETCPACGQRSLVNIQTLLPACQQPMSRPHFLNRRELIRKYFDTS